MSKPGRARAFDVKTVPVCAHWPLNFYTSLQYISVFTVIMAKRPFS